MFTLLRLVFWATAILFASAPVAFEIATTPQNFPLLFVSDSYAAFGRDLIFLAIAVLAIGLVDAFEALLLLKNRRTGASKLAFGFTLVLMIAIFLQLFLFSFWSSHIVNPLAGDAVVTMLFLVFLATMSALFARVTLVASPTGR
jgi:hypothetical protein